LQQIIRDGGASSTDIVDSVFRRIDAVEKNVHAYITLLREEAFREAARADEEIRKGDIRPLTGIPIALKDIYCTRGIPTTCGSRILQNFVAPYDATIVEKLREAGAVFTGKTNMDEFAMGSSTETSWFGVTKNPWDLDRIPGGSSGGSAAAVAADMCIASLGSDTGGSIRQPAALCGVVGLKPTYGRVSRFGLVAFASSLDQIGPFTKDVEDCAILLNVIAGYDPRESTSVPEDVPDYRRFLGRDIRGWKVGIPKEYFIEGIDPEVEALVRQAVKVVEGLGAEIVPVSLPHTHYCVACYYIIAPAEASSNLARYDGVKYGYRSTDGRDLLEMYKKSRSQGFGAEVKRRIMIGTYVLSAGYYDAYYKKASQVRALIRRDFDEVFRSCDVILTPTTPTPAFRIGEKTGDPLQMYLSDVFTISTNLAGIPGISVPCGYTAAGLPVGVQFLAGHFQEGNSSSSPRPTRRGPIFRKGDRISDGIRTGHRLEVHAQMLTYSKIFCGCSTTFGEGPNSQTCPVCQGMPGVLPVLNKKVVEFAMKMSLATSCRINPECVFAGRTTSIRTSRKATRSPSTPSRWRSSDTWTSSSTAEKANRHHPHPHGGGCGKLIHDEHNPSSYVDLNRTGVPLIEIVSEPDMRSAEEAAAYLRRLHEILVYLEVCDGNMEQGSFRCDANVSLRPRGTEAFGIRAELKNMNSFRNVQRALEYEIKRQQYVLEGGGQVVQETRLWDDTQGVTHSMRGKEEAHDYRYSRIPILSRSQ
jgi:aspartyl-tRNA(Asn)/glutamyl-tRNA(Gln) amidotransferase subunit A